MISPEHRLYMPKIAQEKYFTELGKEIPDLEIIENCFYNKMFNSEASLDDEFLKTAQHIFVDCVPIFLNETCLRVIQDQEYKIGFAFSLSKIYQSYALQRFTKTLDALYIPFSYILSNEDFGEATREFKTNEGLSLPIGDFKIPKTKNVIFTCWTDEEAISLGELTDHFESISIITNSESIDFNLAFNVWNKDGDIQINTKNFKLINNYSIKVI